MDAILVIIDFADSIVQEARELADSIVLRDWVQDAIQNFKTKPKIQ